MAAHDRTAVTDHSAAEMFDMPVARFRELVAIGAFPRSVTLADGIERWRVADLNAILDRSAAQPVSEDTEI